MSLFHPIQITSAYEELAGKQCGRWTVIEYLANGYWLCECSCPKKTKRPVLGRSLRHGVSRSCGCIKDEKLLERATKHGKHKTASYHAWSNAKQRCTNPRNRMYRWYGAIGVKMCQGLMSFEDFDQKTQKKIGDCPAGLTLDRINVYGHYSCGECEECDREGWEWNLQWSTYEQQLNNKRDNQLIAYDGKTMTISRWSREKGIPDHVLRHRLRRGWTVERALTEPLDTRKRNTRADERVIELDGLSATLPEWSEKTGISLRNILARLVRGWSPRDALTTPERTPRQLSWKGQAKTIQAWASELGIPADTIKTRLLRGWSVSEALGQPLGHKRREKSVLTDHAAGYYRLPLFHGVPDTVD